MAKSRDGIPRAARSCFIASSVASTVMIGRDAFGARQLPWKTSMSVCLLPQPFELLGGRSAAGVDCGDHESTPSLLMVLQRLLQRVHPYLVLNLRHVAFHLPPRDSH